MTTVDVLDTVTVVTPLGVRFVDEVTGRTISDGLVVSYQRASGVTYAQTNREGIYLLSGLPGLGASELGEGDGAFWASPPAVGVAAVQVADGLGRFLPFSFRADVPFHGPFFPVCGSPASPPSSQVASVPLYSAPSRIVATATATLRLELWDADSSPLAPAAWAVVEIETIAGERLGSGVADERGRLLAPFHYPALPAVPAGSKALTGQTWTVRLSVRYSRLEPVPPVPHDLCEVLDQGSATLLDSEASTAPLPDQTLEFGRELATSTSGQNVVLVSTR
jgi:hypothetical protein